MEATADKPATLDDDLAPFDDLIPLRDAAGILPCRRGGKKTHVATLYRWTDRGCRGVRLRYSQCGSVRCTTRAWLSEFFGALTRKSRAESIADGPISATPIGARTPAARTRALAKADRELEELGI